MFSSRRSVVHEMLAITNIKTIFLRKICLKIKSMKKVFVLSALQNFLCRGLWFSEQFFFQQLLEAAFENVKVPGLAEILEVMGSIINGYIRPYKEEHVQFLQRVLVPLHVCSTLATFHPQLVYCVVQFVENDEELMALFVRGFMKLWPKVSMAKEALFLGELEEVIDVMQPREFGKLQGVMFHQLARSIKSNHYQVRYMFYYIYFFIVISYYRLNFPLCGYHL